MSKPPSRVKRPPLVPDVDLLYQHLWRQFINQPGVFEKLVGHLESVRKEDDTICEMEFPTSEDDFHPLSESSRISVSESTTASARVSLPPMSPRTPGPGPVEGEEEGGVFFMAKNIDLVPDRNIPSPVMVEEKINMSAIKVPVIQYFQPVEVKSEPVESIVEVIQEVSIDESTQKSKPSITNSQPPTTSQSITLQEDCPVPTKVPTFYPPQLPTPLLSPTFISTIQTFFSSQPSSQVTLHTAALLAETLQLSQFLSSPLFTYSFGGSCAQAVSCSQFLSFWQANAKLLHQVKDSVRIFNLLSGCGRKYLLPDDFLPIAKTVLDTHSQLDFFRGPGYHDLHANYLTSVVAAIFFSAGAWRRKRMYFWQFEKLKFEETLSKLSEEEMDINFIEYFSYDQFYVFYVKFVSLDSDEDGELGKAELLDYEEGGVLTRKVVERVWQVNLLSRDKNMDYWDWVIFVMAEVDKTTSPALDYWFAVLDTDDDGLLSLGEMKEFYSESLLLLIIQDINVPHIVRWEDLTTQISDILSSGGEGLFSLMDLRKVRGSNKLAHLLDAFINIFNFIMNDENDVSIRSEMSILQKYVVRSLNDLES
eukprot:TRINITY_DN74903_c0_g1_i1.p1 TRINITY_DN74903_c0_g1~~TRINITY_DN74903_c0_g1_i1.p1  ORF type:complete len:591 (-),score=216.86 TRINITY_DN74903_c0_g1_i1:64-1836(-)